MATDDLTSMDKLFPLIYQMQRQNRMLQGPAPTTPTQNAQPSADDLALMLGSAGYQGTPFGRMLTLAALLNKSPQMFGGDKTGMGYLANLWGPGAYSGLSDIGAGWGSSTGLASGFGAGEEAVSGLGAGAVEQLPNAFWG